MARRTKKSEPASPTSQASDLFRGFVFATGSARRALTDQEERIVTLICDGMSDEEIVQEMVPAARKNKEE